MCGVQATTDTPSSTKALAMATETERSAAPSSMPGKMWQCRLIMVFKDRSAPDGARILILRSILTPFLSGAPCLSSYHFRFGGAGTLDDLSLLGDERGVDGLTHSSGHP